MASAAGERMHKGISALCPLILGQSCPFEAGCVRFVREPPEPIVSSKKKKGEGEFSDSSAFPEIPLG